MKTLVTLAGIFFCNIAFSQSLWIEKVEKFDQGLNNDGGIISEFRSDSSKCIGFAQASDSFTEDSSANYVALGFGGEIDLKFSHPIKNVEGMDLKVHETTFGTPPCRRYPERIILFASQDNCNWYYCGTGCQDTEFDLGELNWAQYVKIIDVSPYGNFDPFGVCDGFDIDAVEGYVRESNPTPTSLIPGTAQQVVSFQQGLRKNETPVTIARSNPENALGLPQGTEVVNFVSLGFGGQLVLKFDFAVFNREGFDFQITETTFGNPQCDQYPEKALVEVSLDGETWEGVGVVCLDAMVEMDTVKYFQYIRISDRSPASLFSSSADGFDVDGIFTFTNCGPLQKVDFDDIISEDEVTDNHVVLSPNPFDDRIYIGNSEKMTVTIYNYVGVKIKEYRNVTKEVNTESLPAGIYYVEILSPTVRSTQKLFKK
jgi:hypothetical protein